MPILIKVDLFLMGSDKICQLRSSMPGIAPQHCVVITRGRRVFVRNLVGGKTYVNNELVPAETEWPLHASDRLVVGPLEFLVQFHEKQLPQRDAESWAVRSLDLDAAREAAEVEEPEEEDEAFLHAPDTASAAALLFLASVTAQGRRQRTCVLVARQHDHRFDDAYMVEAAEVSHIERSLDALNRRATRTARLQECPPDVHRGG